MSRAALLLAVFLGLAACTRADGSLVLRDGYRGAGDHCQSLGRWFTNDPGDASPDAIACDADVAERPPASHVIDLGRRQGFDRYYIVP